jgi:hypothetical protein
MRVLFLLMCCALVACSKQSSTADLQLSNSNSKLYALDASEHQVQFEAVYRSYATQVEGLNAVSLQAEILRTTQYLFGPLTRADIGGPQKGEKIEVQLDKAYVEQGRVLVPYHYSGVWLIHKQALLKPELRLPLPFQKDELQTPQWLRCTDSAPDHQTIGFYWYFWDPSRNGCDHHLGEHYQEVVVEVGAETAQTVLSYPEYQRMIRMENGVPTLSMTFAFGYVEDAYFPNPFLDTDPGARQFQKFQTYLQTALVPFGFVGAPITQAEYMGYGSTVIGTRYVGMRNGVQVKVSVVAAAGVDQMDLFAHGFAKDQEGFFGWFGHSRVGSGFDAHRFEQIVQQRPETFKITSDYQLVYWAGCNSYSYYTMPFFDMKAKLDLQNDPHGTKNLDLISNGLPSLFSFNAADAEVIFQGLFNWQTPTSYQSMINEIESYAQKRNSHVLVNVLGDEDNQLF